MQAGRWGEALTPVLAFRFVVVVFYLKAKRLVRGATH
jgi:hypothetical protein